MHRLGRFFRSQVFVGRDLVGQLVLFDRAGITGRLGRSLGVVANRVFEIVSQRRAPV